MYIKPITEIFYFHYLLHINWNKQHKPAKQTMLYLKKIKVLMQSFL